jgi:hypothetical protein
MTNKMGHVGYIQEISEKAFMDGWLETHKSNARWKLIKFLAKLELQSAKQSTGVSGHVLVSDGTVAKWVLPGDVDHV